MHSASSWGEGEGGQFWVFAVVVGAAMDLGVGLVVEGGSTNLCDALLGHVDDG